MTAMLVEVCPNDEADLILLRRNIARQVMFDGIDARLAEESIDRRDGSWRTVASAWALVLALMVVLAGGGAMAFLHSHSQPDRPLAGSVIPQHDPCVGPGVASAPGIVDLPPTLDHSGLENSASSDSRLAGIAG
jgi:hypothetical protein